MAYWELFQDPADIGHYIEIRIAETWTEHMCQHERVTKNVRLWKIESEYFSKMVRNQ